jgi:hypothetical protein
MKINIVVKQIKIRAFHLFYTICTQLSLYMSQAAALSNNYKTVTSKNGLNDKLNSWLGVLRLQFHRLSKIQEHLRAVWNFTK